MHSTVGGAKNFVISPTSTSEGGIVQQWALHSMAHMKWVIQHVPNSNGYVRMLCYNSGLYLGIDSSNTSLIKQYSAENDYTLWKIERSTAGNLIFKCKATESSGVAMSVPLDNGANGADLVNIAYTSDTNYRDEWALWVDTITNAIRLPNEDAQNKTMWCWAACSKMVGEHNGGDGALNKIPVNPTYTTGMHSYGSNLFYGETSNGNLTVDGGQRQIVIAVHGDDGNNSGNNNAKEMAIQIAAKANMDIGTWGNASLSEANIISMNNELSSGRWVIGNIFTTITWSGHSIVIQTYNESTQEYSYWDPWTNTGGKFTRTELLNNTIKMFYDTEGRTLAWVQFCN